MYSRNRTVRTGLATKLAAPRPLTFNISHCNLKQQPKKISPHTHVLLSLCLQLK